MPNRSSAWVTLFARMSGQPFYGIANGIQYSVDQSVDHLNTSESERLWAAFRRLPEPVALGLLQRLNSPFIVSMTALQDSRLRPLAAFETRTNRKLQTYWLDDTISRAYFVSGAIYAGTSDDALKLYLGRDFPAGRGVVLEGKPRGTAAPATPGGGVVSIRKYRATEVLCEVEAESQGYVVLLDSYYPGWKAYVDGVETEILRANYAFRAVPVEAGKHRVECRYRASAQSRVPGGVGSSNCCSAGF
jgi:hypothetical protein